MNNKISDELGTLCFQEGQLKSILTLLHDRLEATNTVKDNEECGRDFHAIYGDAINALYLVECTLDKHGDRLSELEMATYKLDEGSSEK